MLDDVLSSSAADLPSDDRLAYSEYVARALGEWEDEPCLWVSTDGRFVRETKHVDGFTPIRQRTLSNLFRTRFDEIITPTETGLLASLLTGRSVRSISEDDEVAYETRRNQLQAILSKSGLTRQADLVQIVSNLLIIKLLRLNDAAAPAVERLGNFLSRWFRDEARAYSFSFSKGRHFLVADVGPRSGRPVVFMNAGFFPIFPAPENLEKLKEHNIRALSPIRPGYFDVLLDSRSSIDQVNEFVTDTAAFLQTFK